MSPLKFFWFAADRYSEDLLSVRAQSLAYTTILSMVPLLAVTFSVLKAFGIHNQVEPLLVQALAPLGEQGAEIAVQLVSFVDNLKVGVLGTAGVAGLFYTTVSLVGHLEDSLNAIWRVRRSRSIPERFRDYLAVVLVGPVLVFTAFALTASAESHWMVQRLLAVRGIGTLLLVTIRFVPLLFLCVAFTFLYKFLPRTRVHWGAALAGGVTAAILWQLGGLAFTTFVASSANYTAIYSSFAILIIFLLWLYVSWLIVLLGGEVSYFVQYPLLFRMPAGMRTTAMAEVSLLELATYVARRHLAGEPPQGTAEMAMRLGLPPEVVDMFVDALVQAGILLRSAEPPGIALARPPARVTVGETLATLRDPSTLGDGPVAAVLAQRDKAVRDSLADVTLETLARQESSRESDVSRLGAARVDGKLSSGDSL